MSFDLQRIVESKREMRRKLAGRPVAEKLAMLDALRDRTRSASQSGHPPGNSGPVRVTAGISGRSPKGLTMPGQ